MVIPAFATLVQMMHDLTLFVTRLPCRDSSWPWGCGVTMGHVCAYSHPGPPAKSPRHRHWHLEGMPVKPPPALRGNVGKWSLSSGSPSMAPSSKASSYDDFTRMALEHPVPVFREREINQWVYPVTVWHKSQAHVRWHKCWMLSGLRASRHHGPHLHHSAEEGAWCGKTLSTPRITNITMFTVSCNVTNLRTLIPGHLPL